MPYNVMIVDDAAMMRLYIASFVRSLPEFKVVAQAANGQEALDKLTTSDVDLILLDIEMPVMDGLEFLRHAKLKTRAKISARAKRIVVTGHTDDVPVSGGAYADNWDLASARAQSVVRALEQSGKLEGTELLAVSKGETQPIADNTTPEGREKNRRIEIEIEY